MYNPQLETFIKVAGAGSFSKAADEAFITTTAVIKQINLLESRLGLELFIRSHRGLTLTESGKSLHQDAKYLVQYAKDSVQRAEHAMRASEHIIRIGTSPMTPGQFLVDIWPKIYQYCPDIKFQLIPYENTPENAREILKNLGQNIDIVAGIFDEQFLQLRECAALELRKEPICCAVSMNNKLAQKEELALEDLYGSNLMLIRRGWNGRVDALRDDITEHHPQIKIRGFDFYNVETFNQCENSNDILMTIPTWASVHPLLSVLPVHWTHEIPFGLLHASSPPASVERLLEAVKKVV